MGLAGNASKFDVAIHAVRAAPFAGLANWPQDACDAFCIALATRQALETEAAA